MLTFERMLIIQIYFFLLALKYSHHKNKQLKSETDNDIYGKIVEVLTRRYVITKQTITRTLDIIASIFMALALSIMTDPP